MKKLLFSAIFALVTLPVFSQAELNPLPQNMIKCVGKLTKSQFEKRIGLPELRLDSESKCTYRVADTYAKSYVFMDCKYRAADSVLIRVTYPSKIYHGYKESFAKIPGYQKSDVEYWEAPHAGEWVFVYEEIFTLTMKRENFICEILKQYGLNYGITYSFVE